MPLLDFPGQLVVTGKTTRIEREEADGSLSTLRMRQAYLFDQHTGSYVATYPEFQTSPANCSQSQRWAEEIRARIASQTHGEGDTWFRGLREKALEAALPHFDKTDQSSWKYADDILTKSFLDTVIPEASMVHACAGDGMPNGRLFPVYLGDGGTSAGELEVRPVVHLCAEMKNEMGVLVETPAEESGIAAARQQSVMSEFDQWLDTRSGTGEMWFENTDQGAHHRVELANILRNEEGSLRSWAESRP